MHGAQQPFAQVAGAFGDLERGRVPAADEQVGAQRSRLVERPAREKHERLRGHAAPARGRVHDVAWLDLAAVAVDLRRQRQPEEHPFVVLDREADALVAVAVARQPRRGEARRRRLRNAREPEGVGVRDDLRIPGRWWSSSGCSDNGMAARVLFRSGPER